MGLFGEGRKTTAAVGNAGTNCSEAVGTISQDGKAVASLGEGRIVLSCGPLARQRIEGGPASILQRFSIVLRLWLEKRQTSEDKLLRKSMASLAEGAIQKTERKE